ncbi:DUF3732 domain-containing protein [Ideonella azotifigens]|uniref:DUF3732 domain-containing protein n=2 Tax=Ideonella azotifigens TaxID=513160 RepID=A0ABN1JPW7_9BURK
MGSGTVSLQIAKLVLYSHAGQVRELAFNVGGLSVLTGASKTGKSAIIDIIDYCTGRSECNVAAGVIRKHVGWYGVLFQLGGGQIFVARKNPAVGEKTSPEVYVERGTQIELPEAVALHKNMTVDALEQFLGSAIGISENEHRPETPTRDPLAANFRHALLFSFQDQNDIDSKQRLFHRQGEDFVGQAIRDTFPYFLGAIDEDRLLKQAQLEQARRALRQLDRQVREAEALDSSTYPRAQALLDEARHVGLLDERFRPTSYERAIDALRRIGSEDLPRSDAVVGDGEAALAELRTQRQNLREEMERLNSEIRSTRVFTSETMGFEREAKEQRARLSTVGLFNAAHVHGMEQCPVCASVLENQVPAAARIAQVLQGLNDELETVQAENPRLQGRLAALQREEADIQTKLRENQHRINARIQENEIMRVQQDAFILRARVVGKVQQYVETATNRDDNSALKRQHELAVARVAALEAELDMNAVREKLSAFLNIIGREMTDYSRSLKLEHSDSQLRLDIRNLTVVADTIDGPVPLYKMGSGENWVGYHILAHLALHKWFRMKGRPVPGFIIFDQPSQAHYPPARDVDGSLKVLKDEDQEAVLALFKLIADAASELAPNLQIIVMDHADLTEGWFQSAVVERWRGGEKLIPIDWLQ